MFNNYKSVWFSFLDWKALDFSSIKNFDLSVKKVVDNCIRAGFNSIILHLRPYGDSFYHSKIFPFSAFILAEQGNGPSFDPLERFLKATELEGINVEGWFNPYRIQRDIAFEKLSENNPAVGIMSDPKRQHWVLKSDDGIYYNPSVPEVRQLIIDGIAEVIENYDIAGVHLDDYFYPTTDSDFDKISWQNEINLDQLKSWRMSQIDKMVRQLYKVIKSKNQDLRLGISPQGIMYCNTDEQYCNIPKWMKTPGYCDYITPQIYWGFDHKIKDGNNKFNFSQSVDYWNSLDRHKNLDFYIGLPAYHLGIGDPRSSDKSEWNSGQMLAKMAEYIKPLSAGYSVFRYMSLFGDDFKEIAKTEIDNLRKV